MGSTPVSARAEAWGAPPRVSSGGSCKTVGMAALFGPVVVFAVVGFLIWGLPGLVPAAVVLLVAVAILRTATSALTGALAPQPSEDARLLNIVSGLSGDLGIEAPSTYVVRGEGVNALVFWEGKPAIGLTGEAAEDLPRTELEALVAHCLARLDPDGGLDRSTLTLGGIFGACAAKVTTADDVRAVAVTRYPPALAKIIERATPVSGRFSHLWFAADDASHASKAARVEALQDL